MALINKTFFNFTLIGDESIDDIQDSCTEHFGKLSAQVRQEMVKREEEGFVSIGAIPLANSYGRNMNINSSAIVWEESINFDDEGIDENSDKIWGALATFANQTSEKVIGVDFEGNSPEEAEGVITVRDLRVARKQIRELFGSVSLGVKIIKLGNVEYYCYCIERLADYE